MDIMIVEILIFKATMTVIGGVLVLITEKIIRNLIIKRKSEKFNAIGKI